MSNPSAIPRYLRNPGDEGYRTPTIEDIETEAEAFAGFPFPLQRQAHAPAIEVDNPAVVLRSRLGASQAQDDLECAREFSVSSTPADKTWKLRIRHLTWAFFTACGPVEFRALNLSVIYPYAVWQG